MDAQKLSPQQPAIFPKTKKLERLALSPRLRVKLLTVAIWAVLAKDQPSSWNRDSLKITRERLRLLSAKK